MQAETVFDPALPEFCLTVVPAVGPAECVRAIYRGQRGYCATTYRVESIEEGHRLVAHMNGKLGISPEMHERMVVGSMFGWEVPGAQLAASAEVSCNEVTNLQRADWAMVAVRAFAAETGLDTSGDETETAVADLLANLMHLCDKERIDFDVALMRGRSHYREELADERPAVLSEEELLGLGFEIREDPDQPHLWLWRNDTDGSDVSFSYRAQAVADASRAAFATFELHRCDNCGKLHSDETIILPIKDLHQRVEPGGVMPSGECADCGCLCYPVPGR